MKRWTGRLVKEDLGTGVWVLETDDGERMMLAGEVPAGLANKRVQVEGQVGDAMGIGMVGEQTIEVSNVKRA
jgi:hypothetical protein